MLAAAHDPVCSVADCDRPAHARGWCSSHYNEWRYYGREPLPAPASSGGCLMCGGPMPPKPRTGPPPLYCDKRCRRKAQAPAATVARRRREAAELAIREAWPCADCGAVIPGTSRRRKFCNRACSARAARRAASDRRSICVTDGCSNKSVSRSLCRKHHPTAAGWSRGTPEARQANLRRKTQQRRARLAGDDSAEAIDRDLVGNRDRWRCGLCHKPVNQALPWPHPQSASLDHIEPLSRGGKHILTNVQIAHLDCNIAKGNRGGGEQLLLIG